MSAAPDPMPAAFVDRLLRVAEEQAESTGRIAVVQQQQAQTMHEMRLLIERQTSTMERMTNAMERIESDQTKGRDKAVADLKEHVAAVLRSAGPPKLIGWIIAAAATLMAAALGALAAKP